MMRHIASFQFSYISFSISLLVLAGLVSSFSIPSTFEVSAMKYIALAAVEMVEIIESVRRLLGWLPGSRQATSADDSLGLAEAWTLLSCCGIIAFAWSCMMVITCYCRTPVICSRRTFATCSWKAAVTLLIAHMAYYSKITLTFSVLQHRYIKSLPIGTQTLRPADKMVATKQNRSVQISGP